MIVGRMQWKRRLGTEHRQRMTLPSPRPAAARPALRDSSAGAHCCCLAPAILPPNDPAWPENCRSGNLLRNLCFGQPKMGLVDTWILKAHRQSVGITNDNSRVKGLSLETFLSQPRKCLLLETSLCLACTVTILTVQSVDCKSGCVRLARLEGQNNNGTYLKLIHVESVNSSTACSRNDTRLLYLICKKSHLPGELISTLHLRLAYVLYREML